MQKTMFRVIKDKENPYVMLNKTFLNATNISWKAKGILAYLLSKPDDWKVYESDIVKHSTDGRDGVRKGIQELIKAGYIKRELIQDEKGRLMGYDYQVYEVPTVDGFSDNGKTDNGKSDTTNNDITDNELTKYNKDNGIFSSEKNSSHSFYSNEDVIRAMQTYMNDLFRQKTGNKHPFLKPEQYKKVYESISSFMEEWGSDYDAIIDMMCKFLNTKTIQSDWNINHFATEGMMLNRMYEVAY